MLTKPKIFTRTDIPTPEEKKAYLARVQAVRGAFHSISGFPALPEDLEGLTFEEANDIERVLLLANGTINRMKTSRVYSGELQAGGF